MSTQLSLLTPAIETAANCLHLTETQKAYIAGFFDGEGCFFVQRMVNASRSNPNYTQESFTPSIVVDNSNRAVLETIRGWVGFGSQLVHTQFDHGKRSDIWHYRISGPDAVNLALALLPYLIVKRTQAELLASFPFPPKRPKIGGRGKPSGYIEPYQVHLLAEWDAVRSQQKTIYEQLQAMKGIASRGKPRSNT